MYDYDPALYWKTVHMANDGYVCDQQDCPKLSDAVRTALRQGTTTRAWVKTEGDKIFQSLSADFNASYVVTSKDYKVFDYILSNNPHFSLVMYDEQSDMILFRVGSAATSTVNKRP